MWISPLNSIIASAAFAADSRAQALMETIPLEAPCCPALRWGIVAGAFTIPLILRPIPRLHSAGKTAGLVRDILVPIAIGLSVYFGNPFSLDCYLPEVTAGLLTLGSVIRRAREA